MKSQVLMMILGVAAKGQGAIRHVPLLAGLVAGWPAQAAPPLYVVSPPYSTISQATQIIANNNWQVIVSGAVGETFLYTPSWRVDFSNFLHGSIAAAGINDSGQVVGYFSSTNASGTQFSHAFLFSGGVNGVMTDLNSLLPSATNSNAYGINNNGQIVGTYSTLNKSHAFLYSGGAVSSLDFGNTAFVPAAINNNGAMAGDCSSPNTISQACVVSQGMVGLGTLAAPYNQWSNASAINDKGQVVGSSSYLPNGSLTALSHAFLYTPGSGLVDLGTFGGKSSGASDIDNSGQTVGWALLADNATAHGFLYSAGVMKDLNELLLPNQEQWAVTNALHINSAGQISAIGRRPGMGNEAILLTPIPSATTCLLNWAEGQYPALFAPPAADTLAVPVYAYRYYPATQAYVGVSSVNNHVYYLGADGIMQDVGPRAQWLAPSKCPQQSPFPTECLLNWAESNYPALFAPSGAATAGFGLYAYRNYYYASGHPYTTVLGISFVDNDVYYTDPSGKLWDVGPASQYLSQSGCQ